MTCHHRREEEKAKCMALLLVVVLMTVGGDSRKGNHHLFQGKILLCNVFIWNIVTIFGGYWLQYVINLCFKSTMGIIVHDIYICQSQTYQSTSFAKRIFFFIWSQFKEKNCYRVLHIYICFPQIRTVYVKDFFFRFKGNP